VLATPSKAGNNTTGYVNLPSCVALAASIPRHDVFALAASARYYVKLLSGLHCKTKYYQCLDKIPSLSKDSLSKQGMDEKEAARKRG